VETDGVRREGGVVAANARSGTDPSPS
jgi:hypothetical protein